MEIKAGDIFSIGYPFHKKKVSLVDQDGIYETDSWIPGVTLVPVNNEGDTEAVAHGMGLMELTVVATFKPGKYPERVFFTRSWVDPEGKRFGKGLLKIMVKSAFKRRLNGYYHEFKLEKPSEEGKDEGW